MSKPPADAAPATSKWCALTTATGRSSPRAVTKSPGGRENASVRPTNSGSTRPARPAGSSSIERPRTPATPFASLPVTSNQPALPLPRPKWSSGASPLESVVRVPSASALSTTTWVGAGSRVQVSVSWPSVIDRAPGATVCSEQPRIATAARTAPEKRRSTAKH